MAGLVPAQELEHLKGQNNVPLAIQEKIALLLRECYQHGWIDAIRWASLDKTLSGLMDSQGAAERIKNTPMPRIYDLFIRAIINVYCVLLPLGMVAGLGLWTPLGSTLVGSIFLALDKIGRDLEAPFENQPHDVPLTAITRTIEASLRQVMGEEHIPEQPPVVDGVLW